MVFHVSVSAISQRSCSHGAGRSMSRAAAFRKRLTWAPPFGSFSLSQSESDYFVILKYPDWVILSHNPDGNSDGKPSSFCENLVKLCQNGCDRSNKHMLICHFHFLELYFALSFPELSSVKEYRSEELCWTHAKKRYCPGTKIPRCTAHVQKTCQCIKKHKETVLNADHPQPP